MSPKVYRASDVCETAGLQPYVLRSWEKEFPGIGVQKSADSPRLYRQQDLDQVLLIKQLVFTEGLTLSGARRRLEATAQAQPVAHEREVAEVIEALASDARTRIARVRDGLRSILDALSSAPGTLVLVDDYALSSPAAARGMKPLRKAVAKTRSAATRSKPRVMSKPVSRGKAKSKTKRSRASA